MVEIKPERCPYLHAVEGGLICHLQGSTDDSCYTERFSHCETYAVECLTLTSGLPEICPLIPDCCKQANLDHHNNEFPSDRCLCLNLLKYKVGYTRCFIYLKWQVKGMNDEVKDFMVQYIHPKKKSE
jgi:hypothetical protein